MHEWFVHAHATYKEKIMRGLFRLFILLVIVVAAVGTYRGWFHLSKTQSAGVDQTKVSLTVDKAKMRSDTGKAEEMAKNLGRQARDKTSEVGEKVSERADDSSRASGEAAASVSGTITSVSEGKLRVITDAGQEVDLQVPASTQVTRDGHPGQVADLSLGLRVRVALMTGTTDTAMSINLQRS